MIYVVIHQDGCFSGSYPKKVADKAIENHPNVEGHRDVTYGTTNAEIAKRKLFKKLENGEQGYIPDFLNNHGLDSADPLYIGIGSFEE